MCIISPNWSDTSNYVDPIFAIMLQLFDEKSGKIWRISYIVQWLPEQIECGNPQIGKPAVALWISMNQDIIESPKCGL